MKKIIYTRPDGGLSVVHPVINTFPKREEITEEEAFQRAWKALPLDAINPQAIKESDVPTDRTFREAWSHGGNSVSLEMNKCRAIHRDRMRVSRAAKFAKLDSDYLRADEAGDTSKKLQIASEKQVLRDVTKVPEIDLAQTPEELKLVWPNCLK